MRKVKINAYQKGLVFKNGVYQRMLNEGNYWLWFNEKVEVYEINKPFYAPVELNILLEDVALANALQVIEVKDNEIALQYENGLLKQVLTAGRYTFWKGFINYEFVIADISKIEITENISRTVLQNKLVAPYVRVFSVESYENRSCSSMVNMFKLYLPEFTTGGKTTLPFSSVKQIPVCNKSRSMGRKF